MKLDADKTTCSFSACEFDYSSNTYRQNHFTKFMRWLILFSMKHNLRFRLVLGGLNSALIVRPSKGNLCRISMFFFPVNKFGRAEFPFKHRFKAAILAKRKRRRWIPSAGEKSNLIHFGHISNREI